MTKIDQCNATDCKYNEDGTCCREKVSIDEDGKCSYYEGPSTRPLERALSRDLGE